MEPIAPIPVKPETPPIVSEEPNARPEVHNPLTGEIVDFSSPDSLVENFLSLDSQIRQLSALKREVEAGILFLTDIPEGTKTARFAGEAGTLKITFKEYKSYDQDKIRSVLEMIGPERFGQLFKSEFKAIARPLGKFLSTTHTDATMEAARLTVQDAITTKPAKPSITVET